VIASSDVVVAALVAAIASMVSAGLGVFGIRATRGNRRAINDELDTGNGHTAGQALGRLEEMAWRHEQRLDSVEVVARETKEALDEHVKALDEHVEALDEHVEATRDLTANFRAMQPGLHALIDQAEPES